MSTKVNFYGKKNPWAIPLYTPYEAARYLSMHPNTVYYWIDTEAQSANLSVAGKRSLTFQNLVELYVLKALREIHKVPLQKIRAAVDYFRNKEHIEHPLSDLQLSTDRHNILYKEFSRLINASESGQLEFGEIIAPYLKRIERRPDNVPVRIYPFTNKRHFGKFVSIDPCIQFGKPCVAGTRIKTSAIVERFKAGEKKAELAKDYELTPRQISEAISYEQGAA